MTTATIDKPVAIRSAGFFTEGVATTDPAVAFGGV